MIVLTFNKELVEYAFKNKKNMINWFPLVIVWVLFSSFMSDAYLNGSNLGLVQIRVIKRITNYNANCVIALFPISL